MQLGHPTFCFETSSIERIYTIGMADTGTGDSTPISKKVSFTHPGLMTLNEENPKLKHRGLNTPKNDMYVYGRHLLAAYNAGTYYMGHGEIPVIMVCTINSCCLHVGRLSQPIGIFAENYLRHKSPLDVKSVACEVESWQR